MCDGDYTPKCHLCHCDFSLNHDANIVIFIEKKESFPLKNLKQDKFFLWGSYSL